MKPKPLALSLSKLILVVPIIISFSMILGVRYLVTRPESIRNIGSDSKRDIILQKAPKSDQFFYNGNLFVKVDAAKLEFPSGEKKQVKNFLAWENTNEKIIYTLNQESQELYDIWKSKEPLPITSDKEAIKAIRDSSKAYFSESKDTEEEQELYFGCKMKAYSKGEYGYAIVGPTIEVIFSGIIYCPENISSLSLEDFTSKLSEARISKGEEEFVNIFSEKVFHRKLNIYEEAIKKPIESEEYIFKYGNYFIDIYYLQQGISSGVIFDNFNLIAQELVWRLSKGRTFSPNWEYPSGGKVVLIDLDSDGNKNEIVIASNDKVYVFDSQKKLTWTYNNIEGNIYNAFTDIDLNSDGFSNEIILQTQSQIYAIGKTGELLWSYPVANFLGSFLIIPIDLDADGFADDVAFNYWKSVYVLDSNGNLKWKFSGNDKNIDAILTVDLDKDGKISNLIIGQNGSEAEGMPPTMYAFDEEGMIIWEYELPQDYIFTIIKSDLNCDGYNDEIVVGGNAGAFALDSNGKLLWQNTPRGWTRYLTAIDLNRDGCQNEVIVEGDAGYNNAVDSKGVLIWQSPTWSSLIFNRISPIDLNYDGYSDEVIMSADKIYSLNSQGEEMWVYQGAQNAESSMVVDLDGDGFKDEIIVFGDRIYILDSTGNLIFTFARTEITVADLDLDGISNDIIVSFPDNTYIYNFTTDKKTEIATDYNISDWKSYRNEEYGFEIKYPENWRYSLCLDRSLCTSLLTIEFCPSLSYSEEKKQCRKVYSPGYEFPYSPDSIFLLVNKKTHYSDKIIESFYSNVESIKTFNGIEFNILKNDEDVFFEDISHSYLYILRFKPVNQKIFYQILSTFKFIELNPLAKDETDVDDNKWENTPAEIKNLSTKNNATYLSIDILSRNPNFAPGMTSFFINKSEKLREVKIDNNTKFYECGAGPDNNDTTADVSSSIEDFLNHIQQGMSIYYFDIIDSIVKNVYVQCLP